MELTGKIAKSLPPVSLKFLNILLKDNLPHSQNACQHSRPDLLQQIMNDRPDHFPLRKNHAFFGHFLVARNRNPFELA